MLIPDNYINNVQERFNLYSELDAINDENGLIDFRQGLKDRFGPIPDTVEELFNGLRLRWQAKKLGFERVIIKGGRMRCYFISNPQSSFFETPLFQSFINYISTKGAMQGYQLKQTKSYLILSRGEVSTLKEGQIYLQRILEDLEVPVEVTS